MFYFFVDPFKCENGVTSKDIWHSRSYGTWYTMARNSHEFHPARIAMVRITIARIVVSRRIVVARCIIVACIATVLHGRIATIVGRIVNADRRRGTPLTLVLDDTPAVDLFILPRVYRSAVVVKSKPEKYQVTIPCVALTGLGGFAGSVDGSTLAGRLQDLGPPPVQDVHGRILGPIMRDKRGNFRPLAIWRQAINHCIGKKDGIQAWIGGVRWRLLCPAMGVLLV